MTKLKSLPDVFRAAIRVAAACAFATLIATGAAAQTNTFPGSGNAGVGTTTPTLQSGTTNTMVEVKGTVNPGVGLTSTAAGGRQYFVYSSQTNPGYFSVFDATAGADRFVISNSGNVGIGTASPSGTLHVQGSGNNNTLRIISTNSSSGGFVAQNTQADAQAVGYFENNRGGFTSYGGLLYGGSNNAIGNLFGVSRADKMFVFADGASNLGMAVGTLGAQPLILGTNNAERMRVDASGNVGIGTTSPTKKLHVAGDIQVDGNINAKYQDVAEWVPSSEKLAAGTVVVLDTTKSNQVISSTASYDTRVAGVISAQPGITLGEGGEGKVLVATTGRVRVKVDASRGPIQIGDLLVTSYIPGIAMKSEAVNLGGVQIHRPGTIVGKALEPLAKGKGEILVLLSLQ